MKREEQEQLKKEEQERLKRLEQQRLKREELERLKKELLEIEKAKREQAEKELQEKIKRDNELKESERKIKEMETKQRELKERHEKELKAINDIKIKEREAYYRKKSEQKQFGERKRTFDKADLEIRPPIMKSPSSQHTPQLGTEEESKDPDYKETRSSKEILLNKWKKGQNILNSFWVTWRNDYLLNLRERSQIKLKSNRIGSKELAKVGNIVRIKENAPRGLWKIAKIVELIPNSDGNIRAAESLLPSKNIVVRPLNLLYPLECEIEENIDTRNHIAREEMKGNEEENPNNKRQQRNAAIQARDRIVGQSLMDD